MAAILACYEWQQRVFEACEDPEIEQIAVVGSRGPGKSWTARHVNVVRALQMPGTNHILFRRTSDDIVKQYAPALKELLNDFHGVGRIPHIYSQTYKTFTIACPNGGESRIFLAFAEYAKHAEKHMSMEYATATFDEVTHFEEIIPQLIGGSVRGTGNLKKLYFGNPGGLGHAWCKRRFVRRETRDAKTLVLQPALKDNLELARTDPGYAARLTAGLPEWKQRQWLAGDWEASEGQYFSVPDGAIREVKPPVWAQWYAGVDWGFSPSAFAVVWLAVWRELPTGRHRCHLFADLKLHKRLDAEQAREALDMEERLPAPVKARFADPSTGKETESDSDEQTRTTARTWARNGFVTLPAKRRGRVPGWMLLRQFLTPIPGYSSDPDRPHGVLTISPECGATLAELQDASFETRGGLIVSDDLGGEDHCLVPGTLITTGRGDVPIERVLVGDMVMTRKGLRPVLKSWQTNQDAAVYRVEFANGSSIEGTGNHPVFVMEKGFMRLDQLRYNDCVLTHRDNIGRGHWKKSFTRRKSFAEPLSKLSFSKQGSDVILTVKTCHPEITSAQTADQKCGAFKICIRKFGRLIMGRYRKGIKFITSTVIRLITTSAIYNVFLLRTIDDSTRKKTIKIGFQLQNGLPTWNESARRHPCGTVLTKESSGIRSMEESCGRAENLPSMSVRFAESLTLPYGFMGTDSALMLAERIGCISAVRMTKTEPVLSVETYTERTNMHASGLAPVCVVRVAASGRSPVYNIPVGGEHEYFANGVLVHNCLDSLRYCLSMVYNMNFPESQQLPYLRRS